MERDTASLVTGKKGWEGKEEGGGRDGNSRKKDRSRDENAGGRIDGQIDGKKGWARSKRCVFDVFVS